MNVTTNTIQNNLVKGFGIHSDSELLSFVSKRYPSITVNKAHYRGYDLTVKGTPVVVNFTINDYRDYKEPKDRYDILDDSYKGHVCLSFGWDNKKDYSGGGFMEPCDQGDDIFKRIELFIFTKLGLKPTSFEQLQLF